MNNAEFSNPAYRIETKRLIIRCYSPSDAPMLAESVAESVEHLRPWMPWAYAEPAPMEERLQRLKRFRGMSDLGQDFIYGIFNREAPKLVRGTATHPRPAPAASQLGYWIQQA